MAKTTINPKGAGRHADPEKKTKTSLFMSPALFKNVKILAAIKGDTITDVLNEALEEFIKKWEDRNGPIPKDK